MGSSTFDILLLPQALSPPDLTTLATKLRTFKLHALQAVPKAFSLEYSSESTLPISIWESRISNPGSRILVCLDHPAGPTSPDDETRLDLLLNHDWIGIFTMIGPVPHLSWIFLQSGQPAPSSDDEETRWQLTSLFVLPEHRGKGLAKAITLASIEAGKKMTPIAHSPNTLTACNNVKENKMRIRKRTRFRLIVHPNNKEVANMYLKLGFVDCARYTLREAYIANGDEAYIPRDMEAEKWDNRFGIGMEYLV